MSVDLQNAIIEFVGLAGLISLTIPVTAQFCKRRVARKKAVSYVTIFTGAAVVPLLLGIVITSTEPDVWWSRQHKTPPQYFWMSLGLLGAICTLPAFGVVLRFKRRSKTNETKVV